MEMVKRFSHGQEEGTQVSGTSTSATTALDLSLSGPLRHAPKGKMEALDVIQILYESAYFTALP